MTTDQYANIIKKHLSRMDEAGVAQYARIHGIHVVDAPKREMVNRIAYAVAERRSKDCRVLG